MTAPISPEKFYMSILFEKNALSTPHPLPPTIKDDVVVAAESEPPLQDDRREKELEDLLDQLTLDPSTGRPWPSFISFSERSVSARLNFCPFRVHDLHAIPLPVHARTGFNHEAEKTVISHAIEVMAGLNFFMGFQIYQPTLLVMTTGEPSNYVAYAANSQIEECRRILEHKYQELRSNHSEDEIADLPDIKFLLRQIVQFRKTKNAGIQNNQRLPMSEWHYITSTYEVFIQYSRIRDLLTTYLGFTHNLDINKATFMGKMIINADEIFYEEQRIITQNLLDDPEIHSAAVSIIRQWFDRFCVFQKYPATQECVDYVKSGKLVEKLTQYTRAILDTFEKWIYTISGASPEVIGLLRGSKQPMPTMEQLSEDITRDIMTKQQNIFAIRHALHPSAWLTKFDSPLCKIVVGDGIIHDEDSVEFQYNILHYVACLKSSDELTRKAILYSTGSLSGYAKKLYNNYATNDPTFPLSLKLITLHSEGPVDIFQ